MDKLKELLEEFKAGSITLAQYKRKAAAILSKLVDDGEISDEQYESEIANVNAQTEQQDNEDDEDEIQARIEAAAQRIADRTRTEEAKKRRELQKQLDELRQKNMTDEERRQHAESQLAQREAELKAKEIRLHATDELTANNLPASFVDFVISESEEATTERVNTFKSTFDKEVQAAAKLLIAGDGDPNKGKGSGAGSGGTGGKANPWKQGSIDLARQQEIINESPDLAAQLMREAKSGK